MLPSLSADTFACVAAFLPASDVEPRVRSLVKLFCGPTAAVTRLHQDNFRAHAWLHQLAGRKLCAVPNAPVTTPTTCSTTSATRLPRRASLPLPCPTSTKLISIRPEAG